MAEAHETTLEVQQDLLEKAYSAFDEFDGLRVEDSDMTGNTVWKAGLEAAQAAARDIGQRALHTLVEIPGYRQIAEEESGRIADKDPDVVNFRDLSARSLDQPAMGGVQPGLAEAAQALLERLRLGAPIGHTALGWGFEAAFGVRTAIC